MSIPTEQGRPKRRPFDLCNPETVIELEGTYPIQEYKISHTHKITCSHLPGGNMIIRKETPADFDAISEVSIAAFKDHPFSFHTEQFIINALRNAGALTLSLVAELDGRVVGHAAFSPVTMSDGTTDWYGLGPISVLPDYQQQGIGKALLNEGLSQLKALGGQGCALVGEPAYYQRFGFKNYPELVHEGIPQEYFMILPFSEKIPQGFIAFHEGFKATS